MADIIIDNMKIFLKGKYEIKASITGDLCIIEFPQRTQIPTCRGMRNCYELAYDENICTVKYTRWSDKNKILKDATYTLPNYAAKMFIWCDMVRCALTLKYSYGLINYDIDGAEVDEDGFFKCVPSPIYDKDFEEKQEKLETIFLASYDKIYMDFEDEAEEAGVGDGFRLLCSIFLEVR